MDVFYDFGRITKHFQHRLFNANHLPNRLIVIISQDFPAFGVLGLIVIGSSSQNDHGPYFNIKYRPLINKDCVATHVSGPREVRPQRLLSPVVQALVATPLPSFAAPIREPAQGFGNPALTRPGVWLELDTQQW